MEAMQGQWTRGGIVGGVLLALLGLIAIFTPFVTGLALSVLLGTVLIGGAMVHIVAAFTTRRFWSVVWQVALGIVYGFAGISILTNPMLGLTTLTILVITFFAVEGIVQLIWAVSGSADSRLYMGISGGVSLLLAVMLFAGFPASALWAVGFLFGVDLMVTGITMVLHGRKQRAVAIAEPPAQIGA